MWSNRFSHYVNNYIAYSGHIDSIVISLCLAYESPIRNEKSMLVFFPLCLEVIRLLLILKGIF